ncbi:DUF6456 domain-containing protein [Sphingomonas sp. HT-1]|uniref:DUF6456 domain-containing protein n=1 Tax=unclassified Sphingomonas TaxID=196159 RepID=UPI000680BB79|nr:MULTISPECIES: DUF6456 domain-containing protein [unclassified Sphingomonas]KTF69834.1 hypothetical protein ATB93_07275 [Sphingomonas sp. WG]
MQDRVEQVLNVDVQSRARRRVTVNLAESPLRWLRARGHVDARQFEAGERLRADYERAALGPRVTMCWDPAPRSDGRRSAPAPMDPTLAQIAAKRRFDVAIAAAGRGLADVLWRVVCAGEGLREAEQALGWPSRAGKLVLCLALDRVADHYGLPGSDDGVAAGRARNRL